MSTLPRSENGDFNWWGDDEAIVVQDQAATAIYANKHGGVVLRQQRAWDEENDTYIVVARENAIRVANAILDAAGHGDLMFYRPSRSGAGYEDVGIDELGHHLAWAPPAEGKVKKPKDTTAPERQKRYRDRKRQGVTTDVTLHDGVTHDRNDRNGVTPGNAVTVDHISSEAAAALFPPEALA
jgi:hypothetical protein